MTTASLTPATDLDLTASFSRRINQADGSAITNAAAAAGQTEADYLAQLVEGAVNQALAGIGVAAPQNGASQ